MDNTSTLQERIKLTEVSLSSFEGAAETWQIFSVKNQLAIMQSQLEILELLRSVDEKINNIGYNSNDVIYRNEKS